MTTPSAPLPVQKLFSVSIAGVVGLLGVPTLWCLLSYAVGVSERYLPTPHHVLEDLWLYGLDLLWHFSVSFARIAVGYLSGLAVGFLLAEMIYRSEVIKSALLPNIHAARAIPAAASIPFFILWFGFSEVGKLLIFIFGISLNIAVAVWQILNQMPERYLVACRGFGLSPRDLPRKVLFLMAIEHMLPTLRFSLTVAIGLGVVAELLGAQSGLGYVIQSARATYAMSMLFLCMILFGVMTIVMDYLLRMAWLRLVPWKTGREAQ